jgi:hypothetical protein
MPAYVKGEGSPPLCCSALVRKWHKRAEGAAPNGFCLSWQSGLPPGGRDRNQKNMPLLIRLQRLAALGCKRPQVNSICSIALREFCKEMRLFGGVRSVPSIESALPAFIASMSSAGNTSARVDNASGDLGESGTESVKVASSITSLMLPWISGPEVEKYRLGGEPSWSQRTKTHTQSRWWVSPAQPCTVRSFSPGILASVHWAYPRVEKTLMQAMRRLAVNSRILSLSE